MSDFQKASVDQLRMTREEAEMQFTGRERHMIKALEMIATGRSASGDSTDIEIARDIAIETLEAVGWPTVKKT